MREEREGYPETNPFSYTTPKIASPLLGSRFVQNTFDTQAKPNYLNIPADNTPPHCNAFNVFTANNLQPAKSTPQNKAEAVTCNPKKRTQEEASSNSNHSAPKKPKEEKRELQIDVSKRYAEQMGKRLMYDVAQLLIVSDPLKKKFSFFWI